MAMSGALSTNYSTSAIAYAQQQQQQQALPIIRNQQWIDKQSNTKVLFTYSPETPLVSTSTELIFDIQDLKTGTPFKDVFARVTIIDVQQQVPLKYYYAK